ncbi:FUSC family protein [Streptomyces sp. SID8382]|uniref:FUSC family protein n=1 Tax=Streptomyces malaysiensis TaxID=92644 RepID=UPI000C2C8AF1|nr:MULTISPECIES: FUSC family protein [unclassified Streptomyces]AUA13715.1 Inner membrane protein YccS [Streptomyces sp. M56]MYX63539.1 FUSC family protein [Streptomyces sp. SID8382]
MTWSHALKETARTGLAIERTRTEPLVAVRAACGVALVVGVALWLGSPTLAVSAAFGAFSAGIATFQRSWRPRPWLALAAASGLAVSTFLGYLAAAHTLTFVIMLAVWTLMTGMSWAVGPVSGLVSTQMVAVMLITVTLPTSTMGALGHALLVGLGGVVQAALIVIFPVRPWGVQRDALADALAGVADYARRLRYDPVAPFDPKPLMEARGAAALTPRQARRRPRQLRGYRVLAERIRPVLASLADPVVGAPEEGPERDRVRELLAATGTVLDSVAHAIRHGTPVRVPSEAMSVLRMPEDGPKLSGAARRAALRLFSLVADVVEASDEPVEEVSAEGRTVHRFLPRPGIAGTAAMALRAVHREARWSSPVLRHAVRLCAVSVSGYLLSTALPLGHAYWAPLTSTMVLRPDFAQTYSRGVARFLGTLAGVLVGGGVVALVHPGPSVSAALAVLAVLAMYLLLRTGFIVTSACVSAYVVFLLSIAGEAWGQTVQARVALTLLGGLLAMVAYAVFPAWETPRLRDRLANWLAANGAFATAVFDAYAHPADRRPRQVRDALLDARAARAAWEQSEAQAHREPVRHRGLSRAAARAAQTALSMMGRTIMLLEAHLPERDAAPTEEAGEFAAALRRAMPEAVEAVRKRRPLNWEAVRRSLERWREKSGDRPGVALRDAGQLMDALDDLAEALNRSARQSHTPRDPSQGESP